MTPAKLRLAMAAMGQPETKVGELCKDLGIARLTLYRQVSPTGRVVPAGAIGKRLAAMKAAKLEKWPCNGERRSFAFYHLAHFRDAAKTALNMGHIGTALLFNTYRELVMP